MRGLKTLVFVGFLFMAVFGLLTLFMPAWVASMKMGPEDPVSARYSAAMMLSLAVAMWYAYREPLRNKAILVSAVVGFGMTAVLGLVHGFTGAEEWPQAAFGIVVGGVLAIGIAYLYPKGE